MKLLPPWVKLVIVFGFLSVVFGAGWYVNGLRWETSVADEREAARQLKDKLDKAEAKYQQERDDRLLAVEQSGVLEQRLQSAEAEVITKEVIRYVQSPDAGVCNLPDDWVRIHNSAAGVPGLPDAAALDDGAAASARTDSDALPVVAANYRACRASMTRLTALQEWLGSIKPPEVVE